jgi:hypothetical protein
MLVVVADLAIFKGYGIAQSWAPAKKAIFCFFHDAPTQKVPLLKAFD